MILIVKHTSFLKLKEGSNFCVIQFDIHRSRVSISTKTNENISQILPPDSCPVNSIELKKSIKTRICLGREQNFKHLSQRPDCIVQARITILTQALDPTTKFCVKRHVLEPSTPSLDGYHGSKQQPI